MLEKYTLSSAQKQAIFVVAAEKGNLFCLVYLKNQHAEAIKEKREMAFPEAARKDRRPCVKYLYDEYWQTISLNTHIEAIKDATSPCMHFSIERCAYLFSDPNFNAVIEEIKKHSLFPQKNLVENMLKLRINRWHNSYLDMPAKNQALLEECTALELRNVKDKEALKQLKEENQSLSAFVHPQEENALEGKKKRKRNADLHPK